MNNKYIIGDLQIKDKEPYQSALKLFFKWLTKDVIDIKNKKDILIFTGDITENGMLTPNELDLLIEIFLYLNDACKEIHIPVGNHEYHKKESVIRCLKRFDNIFIYETPMLMNIDTKKVLFLPYLVNKIDDKNMKEYYENLPDELNKGDIVIGHFSHKPFYETDKSWIDVSNINGDIILGHEHTGYLQENKDYYIGAPLIDRYDHKGKDSYILKYNEDWSKKKFIEVPRFIDYDEIVYPNSLPENQIVDYVIWDVKDVIDNNTVIDFYTKQYKELNKTFYYRKLHKKIEESEENDCVNNTDNRKLGDYVKDFYNKKKISKKIQSIVNNKLKERMN